MVAPSSRRSSPSMPCFPPTFPRWKTTGSGKTSFTNPPCGESFLPINSNFWEFFFPIFGPVERIPAEPAPHPRVVPVFLMILREKVGKWGFLEVGVGREIQSLGKLGKPDPYLSIKHGSSSLLLFQVRIASRIPGLFLIPHLLHSRCSKTNSGAWNKRSGEASTKGENLGWNFPSSRFLSGLVSSGNENFLIGFSQLVFPGMGGKKNWDFLQPREVFPPGNTRNGPGRAGPG